MNPFDWLMLGFAALLVVYGLFRGLVRILVGIAATVGAFVLAAIYHERLALRLSWLGSDEARKFAAYALIFAATLCAGWLLAALIRRTLSVVALGWADRLAGGALGFVLATVLIALVILPVVAYLPMRDGLLAGSRLAPYVSVVSDLATRIAPADLAQRYRKEVERLRQRWRGQALL